MTCVLVSKYSIWYFYHIIWDFPSFLVVKWHFTQISFKMRRNTLERACHIEYYIDYYFLIVNILPEIVLVDLISIENIRKLRPFEKKCVKFHCISHHKYFVIFLFFLLSFSWCIIYQIFCFVMLFYCIDTAVRHEFCVVQHKISCKEMMPNISITSSNIQINAEFRQHSMVI